MSWSEMSFHKSKIVITLNLSCGWNDRNELLHWTKSHSECCFTLWLKGRFVQTDLFACVGACVNASAGFPKIFQSFSFYICCFCLVSGVVFYAVVCWGAVSSESICWAFTRLSVCSAVVDQTCFVFQPTYHMFRWVLCFCILLWL